MFEQTEVEKRLSDLGVSQHSLRLIRKNRNKQIDPPFGNDSPEHSVLGSKYWHTYPIQNYDYSFNSKGFRDNETVPFLGRTNPEAEKINICIGDSFTLNIGGPREHSWPYLLSECFKTPTFNFAIDTLPAFFFLGLIDFIKERHVIDKIFVLYNIFDEADFKQSFKSGWSTTSILDINKKIEFLKKNCWVPDAYWQFGPPWAFQPDELKCLYEHFPQAHNYMRNYIINWKDIDYSSAMASDILVQEYQKIAGIGWVSYAKFIELLIVDPKYLMTTFPTTDDKKMVNLYLNQYVSKLVLCNRDGWHMSRSVNQSLANEFYRQSLLG